MYILNDDIDMKAKIAAMARRLEELEMKKMHEVQAISQTPLQPMPCSICRSFEHLVDECPTIPTPPQYKQPAQAPQQASSLEQIIVNLSKKIDNLQDSISRFANLNTMQEKENSPSQPHQNQKGIHEMEAKESDREVDLPTSKLQHMVENETEKEKREKIKGKKKGKSIERDDYDVNIDEEPQRIVIKEELMKKHMPPLLPQALYGKIIQTKSQVRDANFIWDPGKLNQDQIF
ncbi:hypothetical protein CK203_066230 [Vitis vinifera]|uniref:Uncharacterized protein n=1 Tax=Vitis vinifera TaxID=29760 RepID=A0A438G8H2_VITVI|nr:hypothetical protein CK203_066230 [Vitis vinifera]